MNFKDKVLHLDSQFLETEIKAEGDTSSILVSGYASSNAPDRAGDVIPSSAWEKGLANYLKNPIILAYHDRDNPAGRMVEHKIDSKGLWIKARISSASKIYDLVKDGVLTAFSVGFRVKDAEYEPVTELFVIKELELLEISVVAVPCNQDTLFSLSKSFDTNEEYVSFKNTFANGTSAKGLDNPDNANNLTTKGIKMDPKELQEMLAAAATKAAQEAAATIKAEQEAAAAKAKAEAEAEAALQKRINDAVATVKTVSTGADELVKELEKRIVEQEKSHKEALEGLQTAIKDKSDELTAALKSKMTFTDKGLGKDGVSMEEKEKAVLLSKLSRKSIESTKFGKSVLEKALGAGAATSPHLPTQTWEHEVSLAMEAEVRRRLIAEALIRKVQMQTNVMSFPVNPEAGYGTWVTNAQFGTSNSSGAAATHALKEVTLNTYKLATKEYMNFEEEEDSLIVLLPIVRDAMVRRVARSVDKAVLLGAGAGADPIKGLVKYDDVSAVTKQVANAFDSAVLRALRKDLGAWGLDPAEVVYIVNTEAYYDLMDDALFQTMDKVGDRATILTGQVGMVGGSPVLVSSELPAKTAGANTGGNTANVGAIALNAANFMVGTQRGIRFDTDDNVENQQKVLVASLRMGMTQITTNQGQGVSAFRWLV